MNQTQKDIADALGVEPKHKMPNGWYRIRCPFCQKTEHFGVKFNPAGSKSLVSYNCYAKVCGESGSTRPLLEQIGRTDILRFAKSITDDIPDLFKSNSVALELNVPVSIPPIGFQRVISHPYLDGRGFQPWQYEAYGIGITNLFLKLKDYVIFSIYEDGAFKGYLGRIAWDKQQLNEYNTNAKANGWKLMPKWCNQSIDFGKLLYGLDEVCGQVDTVILVEGVTDKANVDVQLSLYKGEFVKCLSTFGKKITPEQIEKLRLRGVRNVVLMYDPDAMRSIKEHSFKLEAYFDVRCAMLIGDKDPGDLNKKELQDILYLTKTSQQVFSSFI